MLSLRAHRIISGGLFASIITLAAIGNVLHDQGWLPDNSTTQLAARIVFFGLFLLFGFSCIPLMVKLVVNGQIAIGNGDVAIVRAVAAHQTGVVIGFWLFLGVGLVIAIPAAIQDGFLGPASPAPLGPSEGTLVVEPGMSVGDMKRLPTLAIKGSANSVLATGGVFDFRTGG
jgi:hypothetical protein